MSVNDVWAHSLTFLLQYVWKVRIRVDLIPTLSCSKDHACVRGLKSFRDSTVSLAAYRRMELLSGKLLPWEVLWMSVAMPRRWRPWTGIDVLPPVWGCNIGSEGDGMASPGDSRMYLIQPSLRTTHHPPVVRVLTVINPPSIWLALFQRFLCTFTAHIIHPDRTCDMLGMCKKRWRINIHTSIAGYLTAK